MSDPRNNNSATKPVFTVELIPVAAVTDPSRALQALIKDALRSYGLRCRSLKTRSFTPGAGNAK